MEFTKLSVAENGWRAANADERPERRGFYVDFPPRKKRLELEDYLRKAHSGVIVSSIPAAIGRAQTAAEAARRDAQNSREQAEASRDTIRNVGIGGLIVIALALVAILIPTWSLISDANSRQDGTIERIQTLEQTVRRENTQIGRQSVEISKLRASLPGHPRSGTYVSVLRTTSISAPKA